MKANHPEKSFHPCQFPSELAERCVLALSNENDLVLDPFVGAGTSVIAALRHGRYSVGIDQSERYVALALDRIAAFHSGHLKLRAIGKTTHQPKRHEKVANIPTEWR